MVRSRAFSEQCFELGERQFNRIQIGRIGWQVAQFGANRFDGLANAGNLVAGEIVHDHDVARPQDWRQVLLDAGPEHCAVNRPFNCQRSDESFGAQRARKVVVCQRPQGVFSTKRVPSSERP